MGRPSVLLSLTRQIFCLIPIFWLLSLLGLSWTWLAFPLSECITDIPGILLYRKTLRQWKEKERSADHMNLMIASDIHGSARYCRALLAAFAREGRTDCCCWGTFSITGPTTTCRGVRPEGSHCSAESVEGEAALCPGQLRQ